MNQAQKAPSERAHERKLVIASESYPLQPPRLFQEVSGQSEQATELVANPVFMTVTPGARVWFNGVGTIILDQNDEVVFRFGNTGPARFHEEAVKTHLPGRAMVLGTIGAHCYYHWMVDVLPRLEVIKRAGYDWDSVDHFLVRDFDLGFQKATLEVLGIPASKIVCTKDSPAYTADELLHVELRNFVGMRMHRFVPEFLRSCFLKSEDIQERPQRKIFITRPKGVNRAVLNEQELLSLLTDHGFQEVTMEGYSLFEQAALFASADVIVTTHGGALTNLVYCRPGTKVIELFGEHVFSYYYGLANLCGLDYSAVLRRADQIDLVIDAEVGNRMNNQTETIRQDADINIGALSRALSAIKA
ncbi:glycosyltransferase family 61 protein [Granulosicoccaceae sp. 1_MG-2023]|nr:glycosyltransferase family 61 protein [Granulosicoccaceae sp. 1_MG-2023]